MGWDRIDSDRSYNIMNDFFPDHTDHISEEKSWKNLDFLTDPAGIMELLMDLLLPRPQDVRVSMGKVMDGTWMQHDPTTRLVGG